jgi:hypothetical protein
MSPARSAANPTAQTLPCGLRTLPVVFKLTNSLPVPPRVARKKPLCERARASTLGCRLEVLPLLLSSGSRVRLSVVEQLSLFVVVIPDVHAVLENVDSLSLFLNSEGQFQVDASLEAHVMSQIVAATPAFGTSDTGLIAQLCNGIATMRGTGANSTITVLNPTDAVSLNMSTIGADDALSSRRARPERLRRSGPCRSSSG